MRTEIYLCFRLNECCHKHRLGTTKFPNSIHFWRTTQSWLVSEQSREEMKQVGNYRKTWRFFFKSLSGSLSDQATCQGPQVVKHCTHAPACIRSSTLQLILNKSFAAQAHTYKCTHPRCKTPEGECSLTVVLVIESSQNWTLPPPPLLPAPSFACPPSPLP